MDDMTDCSSNEFIRSSLPETLKKKKASSVSSDSSLAVPDFCLPVDLNEIDSLIKSIWSTVRC